MKRKILVVVLVSFLLLLTVYAGSSLAGGDKNQNQHESPVGEPHVENPHGTPSSNSDPASPTPSRIGEPEQPRRGII